MSPILSSLIALGLFFQWRTWRPLPPLSLLRRSAATWGLGSQIFRNQWCSRTAKPSTSLLPASPAHLRMVWGRAAAVHMCAHTHMHRFQAVPTRDSQGTAQGQPLRCSVLAGWASPCTFYSHSCSGPLSWEQGPEQIPPSLPVVLDFPRQVEGD